MNKLKSPVNINDYYHAHVYFEQESLAFASDLCQKAGDMFKLKVGLVHQKAIGLTLSGVAK